MPVRSTVIRRLGIFLTVCCLTATASPAFAARPIHPGGSGGTTTTTPGSGPGEISSKVTVTGSDNASSGQPIVSSDATWTAPPCWFEPFFSPDEFKAYLMAQYEKAGKEGADTVYRYYNSVMSDMNQIHYHQGDKGEWWLLVLNDHLPPAEVANCRIQTSWVWVSPTSPAPPAPITPTMLSQIAYGATKLPQHPVTLSPAAANQTVNLPTYVKFDAPINRVWVTAQLASLGIAATVVAVPTSLHVDAGTSNADPQSCDYSLTATADGAYQVDSSSASCNITYRKATPPGTTHPLKAQLTWKVTWTPTASPNGPTANPPLPDGYSTATQPVTVKEIQTINR